MRRAVSALVLVAAALVAGCSVSSDHGPAAIDDAAVPFGLLKGSGTSAEPVQGGRVLTVCLLKDGLLVSVERRIAEDADLLAITRALGQLTDSEAARGLQSTVSGPDEIRAVTLRSGTATIDLAKEAEQTLTADPLATVSQLTCTLTSQPGVGLLKYSLGGAPIEVPKSDGSLTDSPVARDDYASLFAPKKP